MIRQAWSPMILRYLEECVSWTLVAAFFLAALGMLVLAALFLRVLLTLYCQGVHP